MDCCLAKVPIIKSIACVHLLGIASLVLAIKFEQSYSPWSWNIAPCEYGHVIYVLMFLWCFRLLRKCVEFSDFRFSAVHVLVMEEKILKILSFDVSQPTTYKFMQYAWFSLSLQYSGFLFLFFESGPTLKKPKICPLKYKSWQNFLFIWPCWTQNV